MRSGRYQVRLHHKQERSAEDSIWEEVYHTGRVALVLVRDWERGALITAHKLHLRGSSFGCLSILQTKIQPVSQKRSMALLGGPVRTLNIRHLAPLDSGKQSQKSGQIQTSRKIMQFTAMR